MLWFSNAETDELRRGELRLECLDMTLDNGDTENPRTFSGPGEIMFREDRRLEFVLYDSDAGFSFHIPQIQAGEWLPESELFDLTATDLSGRLWHGEDIRPDINSSGDGAVVRGHVWELSSEDVEEHEGSDFLWLYFADALDLPTGNVKREKIFREGEREVKGGSVVAWKVECDGIVLDIRPGDVGVDVRAKPSDGESLPPGLDTRIQEALWFALGQSVRADALNRRSGDKRQVIVRSRSSDIRAATSMPPYVLGRRKSTEVVGDVLCAYLQHVIEYREERFHPLSVLVRKALRGSAGTIEEEALAICVAVEGVVQEHFSAYGEPDEEEVEAARHMEEIFAGRKELERIDHRIKGFVGSLQAENARSALLAMGDEEDGTVPKDQVRAWEALRHPAAHGSEYQMPHREVVQKRNLVRQLLNTLVLRAIGYEGVQTDYSTVGWPDIDAQEPRSKGAE